MRNIPKSSRVAVLAVAALLAIGSWVLQQIETANRSPDEAALFVAIEDKRSDVQVLGDGTVVKILPDDNHGSRHQRFLVKLDNGHVILIAHNIDLAPRIDALRERDTISFFGEFEWNEKGGVVHWTHHDPRNKHPHGWLEHRGKRYQ